MPDRTFYPGPEAHQKLKERLERDRGAGGDAGSDILVSFGKGKSAKAYRAVVCNAFDGEKCSVTARRTEHFARDLVPSPLVLRERLPNPYTAARGLRYWPADRDDPHRSATKDFVNRLWELINGKDVPSNGVIVVAGATGSRKTTYARELARRFVDKALKRKGGERARPHVVTCEDPIESYFAYSPEDAIAAGFDYTPRQRGKDVPSLHKAITDALRQKPALLYVNEIRNDRDWHPLLRFAGTGHLAITTTHAGSLVESFERILMASRAHTPDERSHVASRIIAIVHVRDVEGELVPAMWVQTPRSRIGLTQDGLASLLPTSGSGGCYGRAILAKELGLKPHIVTAALKCDLAGE